MNLLERKRHSELRILVKRFNKLCELLDDEYKINRGGCCIVAYYIAKLLKMFGYSYTVVIYGEDDLPLRFEDIDLSQYHYCIKTEGLYINSGNVGVSIAGEYENVPLTSLKNHYYTMEWNETYEPKNNTKVYNRLKNIMYDFVRERNQ